MDIATLIKLWEQRLARFDQKAKTAEKGTDDELNAAAKAAELRECLGEIGQLDNPA